MPELILANWSSFETTLSNVASHRSGIGHDLGFSERGFMSTPFFDVQAVMPLDGEVWD